MGHRRKKKKAHLGGSGDTVELNIMPFVDIFSLLTTFLLFSAVFVQIGVLEVQVPFLSNAAPPPDEKPTRVLAIKVDARDKSLEIMTSWSLAPIDKGSHKFDHTEEGVAEMHAKLVELRSLSPENDKLTLFVDDDVTYERVAFLLDAIKLRKEGDAPMENPTEETVDDLPPEISSIFLFPKVVMGSVIL